MKQLTVMLALLCAAFLLAGCASGVQKSYEAAEALLQEGRYGEAVSRFAELGSFEDASRLLMYSRAAQAGENGDYTAARTAFTALGEFRDSREMTRYYEAREIEALGSAALETGDFDSALRMLKSASELYGALPALRDTAERRTSCLDMLYSTGISLVNDGRYETAGAVFQTLESWKDSGAMRKYCEACLLEEKGDALKAAAIFAEIPDTLDAGARADETREIVYQEALSVSDGGDHETAISLLAALGSYRDAETRRLETVRLLLRDRLRSGDYEGALLLLDGSEDAITLEQVPDRGRFSSFLDDFVNAYLHFSAGTMDSWAGYYGVLPYIEEGSALDSRFRQVTMIGSYSHNSGYTYYGSNLLDVFRLDGDYYLAYVRASASALQPVGGVEVTRTFRIVVWDAGERLIAGSIEDCLYGETVSRNGRPVVTGPLPDGELPPDEDGDGIILVDVMKKGFQGTMIIVLDPSRIFVGGPGFYGGNGMLLEELAARYDALGGINGGGFIDEDGGGSGGYPEGLTIVDGKAYHWAGSGASAAFDGNNVLHVGYYTEESAAAAGIRDCVSFGPALIVNGQGEYGSYMQSGINPRTAIGQREDGAVLLLCIDGRQLHSIGANYGDIRDVMFDFGAVNACSMDGGSSTVMYFNGKYLNSPSSASGTSRYLPNAFLISR